MLKKLFPMLVGTFLCFGILNLANAGNPHDGLCADLEGTAFGLCNSAVQKDCGTDEEQNSQACDSIEKNYVKTTGEMPPWIQPCPCWTQKELRAVNIDEEDHRGTCRHYAYRSSWRDELWVSDDDGEVRMRMGTTRNLVSGEVLYGCSLSVSCDDESDCTRISRYLGASEEQYVECTAMLIREAFRYDEEECWEDD